MSMTKADYYEILATTLAPYWEQDARMSEEDSGRWRQARDIDDWLVAHREDAAITLGAYRLKCVALSDLYKNWR